MKHKRISQIISILLIFFLPFASLAVHGQVNNKDDIDQTKVLGVVLNYERSSDADVLLLKNGDKLTGTILNDTFEIKTSYASMIFSKKIIAGIDQKVGENNIDAIVTVNNNRFSGIINDAPFEIEIQTGQKIQIRREKILKAIIRIRDDERKGIPQRQFIILKNGDYFSGNIINKNFNVVTTYAKIPFKLEDANSITRSRDDNPLTKIVMNNHDIINGVLESEDINVELDVGPKIDIHKERINIIYCKQGYIPEIISTHKMPNLITLGTDTTELGIIFKDLKVIFLCDGPGKKSGLKCGDVFISADGEPLKNADQIKKIRDDIFSGSRSSANFLIQRDSIKIPFKMVK